MRYSVVYLAKDFPNRDLLSTKFIKSDIVDYSVDQYHSKAFDEALSLEKSVENKLVEI